jgi:hypothetical protein
LPSSIPSDLRKLIVESSNPAARLLEALSSDPEQPATIIKKKPLAGVTSDLQRLGINYRAGLAEVSALAQQHSAGGDGARYSTVIRRLGWQKPRATRYAVTALAGAMAATFVLLVLDSTPHYGGVTIDDEHATSAVGELANGLVLTRGLKELAERRDPQAQFVLGLFYATGQGGLEKSYEKSIDWWNRAVASGSSEAKEALSVAGFRDEGPLPQKWANIVTSLVKDKSSFDNLSPKEVAEKLTAMVNVTVDPMNVTTDVALGNPARLSVYDTWLTVKNGGDVNALKAFAAQYRDNFYGEMAVNEATAILKYGHHFDIHFDKACTFATSTSPSIDVDKVRIWSLPAGQLKYKFSLSGPVTEMALSKDAKRLLLDRPAPQIERRTVDADGSVTTSFENGETYVVKQSGYVTVIERRSFGVSRPYSVKDGVKMPDPETPVRVLNIETGEISSISSSRVLVEVDTSDVTTCFGTKGNSSTFSERQ